MESNGNEKSVRLQVMLKEALKPLIEKQESLEHEITTLQQGQQELKTMLERFNKDTK